MNNNNGWKFIIPVILIALFGYQTMQSKKEAQVPPASQNPQNPQGNPQNPQGNPQKPQDNPQNPQGNPQNPQDNPQTSGQGNPQNSELSALFGTWKAEGSNNNGQVIAIFYFQPNGTFEIQQMNTGNNGTSLEAVISGYYKRTGQNSYIFLPEKRCNNGNCSPGGEPATFTLTSSNEILFNGITFRKTA
jgi:hypothetical protein